MNLEIKSSFIPGTLMVKSKMGDVSGLKFLDKIFYITDGIMLSQIREICGIDGSTLQNWTKRGWVASSKNKRYNKDQLSRILIINMMRDSMQLEHIARLLTYVNGRAGDESDDIIPESLLYDYICRVVDQLVEEDIPVDSRSVRALIARILADYKEPAAGAKARLENACEIMVFAYYTTLVRQKVNDLYEKVFG